MSLLYFIWTVITKYKYIQINFFAAWTNQSALLQNSSEEVSRRRTNDMDFFNVTRRSNRGKEEPRNLVNRCCWKFDSLTQTFRTFLCRYTKSRLSIIEIYLILKRLPNILCWIQFTFGSISSLFAAECWMIIFWMKLTKHLPDWLPP